MTAPQSHRRRRHTVLVVLDVLAIMSIAGTIALAMHGAISWIGV